MAKIHTAERVSQRDASDNFVFQRSLLAYHKAAEIVGGDVLEIGTGMGYGVDVIAPSAKRFMTIDKSVPQELHLPDNAEFRQMTVPPLQLPDAEFDYVVSFQVIEHIKDDEAFVREVYRVLRHGGRFVVSTPNAPMSLTRNPWHVREYRVEELKTLLESVFDSVECYGVRGNDKVMAYYEKNREGVRRITRYDVLDLQHRLPRWMLQLPYDVLNRLNRRRLLTQNDSLTRSITMADYEISPATEDCFDLYFVAEKR
jgi:SAM-dependent methyltransferase